MAVSPLFVIPQISYQSPVYILETKEPTIEEVVQNVFGERSKEALAIIKAESRSDPKQIGYNCRYGTKITSCAPKDRHLAVSVDCGLWQINEMHYKTHLVCPEESFDPIKNTLLAKDIYDERIEWGMDGFSAWWSYTNKKHIQYL